MREHLRGEGGGRQETERTCGTEKQLNNAVHKTGSLL